MNPELQQVEQQVEEDIQDVGRVLFAIAAVMPPQSFRAALAGMVATVLGSLPEDYWQEFVKVEPCSRPGCDCHEVLVPKTVEAFKMLRDDYLATGPFEQSFEE